LWRPPFSKIEKSPYFHNALANFDEIRHTGNVVANIISQF